MARAERVPWIKKALRVAMVMKAHGKFSLSPRVAGICLFLLCVAGCNKKPEPARDAGRRRTTSRRTCCERTTGGTRRSHKAGSILLRGPEGRRLCLPGQESDSRPATHRRIGMLRPCATAVGRESRYGAAATAEFCRNSGGAGAGRRICRASERRPGARCSQGRSGRRSGRRDRRGRRKGRRDWRYGGNGAWRKTTTSGERRLKGGRCQPGGRTGSESIQSAKGRL